jgi:intracellular multiplication protein IcmT
MREAGPIPWAFSAKRPRLWILDARAVFPIGLCLIHWSLWTFFAAGAAVAVLALLERAGLPPGTALLRLRSVCLWGPYRPSGSLYRLRRRSRY